MARAPRDDDDVPWLAEGVREPQATMVPRARLLGGGIIAVLLAVLVAVGVYLAAGHKSDGSTGYARPEDAPLIAADAGPDKVRPADPGGAQITGIDDTIAAAAGGNDQGSAIAPETIEEPLARPGTPEAAAPPPTDLLPATIPPARTIVPAPVVAPAAAMPRPAVKPEAIAPTPPPAKPPAVKPAQPAKADALAVDAAKTKPAAAADPLAAVPGAAAKPKRDKADAPAKSKRDPVEPEAAKADPASPKAGMAKAGDTAAKASLQLGAFSTRDKAEAAWGKAGGDGALAGLSQRIETVERDGRTLYRLRAAGVPSKAAAAALCGRVKAAGNACIVAE